MESVKPAGQAEEPQPFAAAAVCPTTYARAHSLLDWCIWYHALQPSEDFAHYTNSQPRQHDRNHGAVWTL